MMENTIFEISDEEREEIEKLYRIIHSNKIKLPESENPLSKILEKENFIVTDHILMFVQNMTKNYMLTRAEIAPIAKNLDFEQNSLLTESNFVKGMTKWIKSSSFYTGLHRNNLSLICGLNERKIFHYSLACFFDQNMNNEINDQFYFLLAGFQEIVDLDFVDIDHNLNKSAEEKIIIINQTIEQLKQNGPIISFELNQEDFKYSALTKILDMIKIITFSRKQNELKIISNLISDIINFIFGNAIINIIKTIMEDHNSYCLESLKIVSHILATNVIQNEIYNLSSSFRNIPTSQILFEAELIQRIIELTNSILASQEVKVQAVCCLALYCKFNDLTAVYLLNQGIIDLFINMIVENDTTGLLDKISWFFAIMGAVIIPKYIVNIHFSHINKLLKIGTDFLRFNNEFVIRNGIHILRGLLPFCKMDNEVSYYINEMFDRMKFWNNNNITKSTLVAIRDLIYSNNEGLIKEMMRKELFSILISVFSSNNSLILMILNIIKQLAQKSFFLEIFDGNKPTITFLLKSLIETSIIKNYVIKILKIIVLNANDLYVGLLAEQRVVLLIFSAMSNFKENDELFQSLYNYKEAIFNFAFLEDCLTTLIAILDRGNSNGGPINQYIKYFDTESLEKFKICFETLFEKDRETKVFLKKPVTYRNRTISMGKFIYYFLEIIEKYQIAYNNNNYDDKTRLLGDMKNTYIIKLIEKNPEEDFEDIKSTIQIKIKCFSLNGYPNGANFNFVIPRTLRFEELQNMIQIKYNYSGLFYLHYEDNLTKERRIIDNNDSYSRVVFEAMNLSIKTSSDFLLKLLFQPIQNPNSYMNYSNRAYSPSPIKNFEVRSCEMCFSNSPVPYDPINRGKPFVCEPCKKLVMVSSYPQNLPIKPLSSFYSPPRTSIKQPYLLYEP